VPADLAAASGCNRLKTTLAIRLFFIYLGVAYWKWKLAASETASVVYEIAVMRRMRSLNIFANAVFGYHPIVTPTLEVVLVQMAFAQALSHLGSEL
jgi:hypothetical protein